MLQAPRSSIRRYSVLVLQMALLTLLWTVPAMPTLLVQPLFPRHFLSQIPFKRIFLPPRTIRP